MKTERIKYTGLKDKVKKVLDGFSNCKFFNSDLSQWTIFNCKNFSFMLDECRKFNADLSDWDVSNGENFQSMFFNCRKFNSDLSEWDVSKAKSWDNFAENSLLEKHPEHIPERFRENYLK